MLHAGPPLTDARRPPLTLESSVVMTCLHEGWAGDEAAALALLRSGALSLHPAQARGCVTPLAAIVSAGTPLLVVGDGLSDMPSMVAPVSAVRGADTRMGSRDPDVLRRLRYRDTVVAPALSAWLEAAGPLALWPMAAAGLVAGDDLHGSTQYANEALVAALAARGATPEMVDDVAATPLFFLTLWMAASALILRAAEGGNMPTLVTRAGGNGEQFGIALAGDPNQWLTCAADPPAGPRLAAVPQDTAIEGAIGDSAVIDMLGLGGQRLAHAPALRGALLNDPAGKHADDLGAAQSLLMWPHPLLADQWPLGLDARRVGQTGCSPRVMLAMLGRDGLSGLCGRGVYSPPAGLFEAGSRG